MTTLYVGSLDYDVKERDLKDVFEKYGPIKETRVLIDRDTGKAKGYGFVTYDDERDAEDAVRGADGKEINNRRIKVEFSRGGSKTRGGGGGGGGYRGSRRSSSPGRDRRGGDRYGDDRRDQRRRSRSGSRDRSRR